MPESKNNKTAQNTTLVTSTPVPKIDLLVEETLHGALHAAASQGDKRKVKKFIKRGAKIDAPNHVGQTGLFISCYEGHERVASLLIAQGADPNRRSDEGSTPVHAAGFGGNPKILTKLIQAGGDLRLHDKKGRTLKDWAKYQGDAKKKKRMLNCIEKIHQSAISYCGNDIQFDNHSSHTISTLKDDTTSLGHLFRHRSTHRPTISTQSIVSMGYGKMYFGEGKEVGSMGFIPMVAENSLRHDDYGATYYNGAYMVMESMQWRKTLVTVRRLSKKNTVPSKTDLLITDNNFMGKLRHQHILLLMGICQTINLDGLILLYERVVCGSLFNYLYQKAEKLDTLTMCDVMRQISDAVVYIHQQGIQHCNINSHSIHMITQNFAKLGNMEYAVEMKGRDEIFSPIVDVTTVNVAYNWLAPEMMAGYSVTEKSDVYSLCAVLWELREGMPPWSGMEATEIKMEIVEKRKKIPIRDSVGCPFVSLLQYGLSLEPRTRQLSVIQYREIMAQIIVDHVSLGLGSSAISPVASKYVPVYSRSCKDGISTDEETIAHYSANVQDVTTTNRRQQEYKTGESDSSGSTYGDSISSVDVTLTHHSASARDIAKHVSPNFNNTGESDISEIRRTNMHVSPKLDQTGESDISEIKRTNTSVQDTVKSDTSRMASDRSTAQVVQIEKHSASSNDTSLTSYASEMLSVDITDILDNESATQDIKEYKQVTSNRDAAPSQSNSASSPQHTRGNPFKKYSKASLKDILSEEVKDILSKPPNLPKLPSQYSASILLNRNPSFLSQELESKSMYNTLMRQYSAISGSAQSNIKPTCRALSFSFPSSYQRQETTISPPKNITAKSPRNDILLEAVCNKSVGSARKELHVSPLKMQSNWETTQTKTTSPDSSTPTVVSPRTSHVVTSPRTADNSTNTSHLNLSGEAHGIKPASHSIPENQMNNSLAVSPRSLLNTEGTRYHQVRECFQLRETLTRPGQIKPVSQSVSDIHNPVTQTSPHSAKRDSLNKSVSTAVNTLKKYGYACLSPPSDICEFKFKGKHDPARQQQTTLKTSEHRENVTTSFRNNTVVNQQKTKTFLNMEAPPVSTTVRHSLAQNRISRPVGRNASFSSNKIVTDHLGTVKDLVKNMDGIINEHKKKQAVLDIKRSHIIERNTSRFQSPVGQPHPTRIQGAKSAVVQKLEMSKVTTHANSEGNVRILMNLNEKLTTKSQTRELHCVKCKSEDNDVSALVNKAIREARSEIVTKYAHPDCIHLKENDFVDKQMESAMALPSKNKRPSDSSSITSSKKPDNDIEDIFMDDVLAGDVGDSEKHLRLYNTMPLDDFTCCSTPSNLYEQSPRGNNSAMVSIDENLKTPEIDDKCIKRLSSLSDENGCTNFKMLRQITQVCEEEEVLPESEDSVDIVHV